MKETIKKMMMFRYNELVHYIPTSFFRKELKKSFEYFIEKDLLSSSNNLKYYEVNIDNNEYIFVYENLKWDSDFFKMPTLKLNYVLFSNNNYYKLVNAVKRFKQDIIKSNYIFIEIPSEDILLIQALNENKFRLVETRLTYYLDLNKFNNDRYPVREATFNDIQNIRKVSSEMVNPYDRFHADQNYDKDIADKFLGVFAEESIKGFADYVMLPNEKGLPSDSFLTAKYYKNWWDEIGVNVSKMVLSAVSSKTNKGWYIKLISEMAYHLKSIGADYSLMHPASTNKAVIHSYEKLGCKLGKVTHILSYKKSND